MADVPVLELRSIEQGYDAHAVVSGVSFALARGDIACILGPSGCGKTTLLRLMIGLLSPDGGEVLFREAPLSADNLPGLRTRMGYVVQDGGLFPHLTAAENVCLMARHLAWDGPRVQQRLGQLSELVRLPGALLARYPAQLSGGEKQRVSLMRALMLDPELLLLDEPLGALDPLVRADLQDDLARIFAAVGQSVVVVTHDLAEAAFFGQVIVLLQDGRIVQQGTIDDLLERPLDPFVSRFVRAQRYLNVRPEPSGR